MRGVRRRPTLPEALTPAPHELGLLTTDPHGLGGRTVRAWRVFAGVADRADLTAATRSRGNTARDLLVAVGSWPDSRGLGDMVADARAGATSAELQSESDARLRAAHRGESDAEVRAAVHRAADHLERWWDEEAADQARLVTPSPLGPVPIGTYLFASVFHLAVTARDLAPAGAPASEELDVLGVQALVDSAGAVAARLGATASIAALSPHGATATGARDGGWRTLVLPPDPTDIGPAVVGPAGLVVDVAAGRVDFLTVARSLRLRHPRRLADMSVVLDGIPELPAATMLRRAAAVARALPW